MNKRSNIKTVKKNDVISYYQLVVCSKKIVYFLKDITKNKTEIPSFIYKNKKFKKAFIQGLMDSDGWISKVNASDGYIRYRVGFKNISKWIFEFRDMIEDVDVRVGEIICNEDYFYFSINSYDYCSRVGFKIKRKRKIAKKCLLFYRE